MELKKRVKESERLNASVVFSLEALDFLETEGSASLTELSGALGIHKSRSCACAARWSGWAT